MTRAESQLRDKGDSIAGSEKSGKKVQQKSRVPTLRGVHHADPYLLRPAPPCHCEERGCDEAIFYACSQSALPSRRRELLAHHRTYECSPFEKSKFP